MRWLLNIFLLLVLIVVLLFSGLFFMVELQEEKIVSLFKSRVEENLRTHIQLGKIDINLIRHFPNASIELEEVIIHSVPDFVAADFDHPPPDTLCYFQKVYLEFSLIALLRGKYEINATSVHKGEVNIIIDKQGNNNYTIWRQIAESSPKKPLTFNIENVTYRTIQFSYRNKARQVDTKLSLDKGKLNVHARSNDLTMGIKTNLTSQYFQRGTQKWFRNVPLKIQGELTKTEYAWKFDQFDLSLFQRNNIQLSGQLGITPRNIDLRFQSTSLNINRVLELMPHNLDNEKWTLASGNMQAKGTIKGAMQENKNPRVDLLFEIKQAQMKDVKRDILWHIDNAKGTFSNGSSQNSTTSYLGIEQAVISSGKKNRIHLNGSLQHFDKQYLTLETSFDIDHHILNKYLAKSAYRLQAGKLNGQFEYSTQLALHDTITTKILIAGIKKGYCHVQDVEIQGKGSIIKSAGKLLVDNNWQLDSAYISAGTNTINFTGVIVDPLQLFQPQPVLTARVSATIGVFHLKDFIAFVMQEKNDKRQTGNPLQYQIKAEVGIDQLVYNKVKANQVKVTSTLENNRTRFHDFQSQICSGRLNSSGVLIRQSDGTYYLRCKSHLNEIDIHQLFFQFNDFNQTFLVSDNIQGNISGEVDYYSEFDSSFAFQKPSLVVNTDISIIDGELKNFEPLFSLSNYIRLDELKHVRFANMENNILIKDQTVFIPQMMINSSAMDIQVSGKHYFDNTFDYNVQVNLAEILAHKFTNRKKTFEDVGYIVDEKGKSLGIPLRISGNPENHQVKYNRQQAKTSIREALQEEKKELNTLFQKNTPENNEPIQSEQAVKVVWEEEDEPAEKETTKKEKDPESFQIEWDDE